MARQTDKKRCIWASDVRIRAPRIRIRIRIQQSWIRIHMNPNPPYFSWIRIRIQLLWIRIRIRIRHNQCNSIVIRAIQIRIQPQGLTNLKPDPIPGVNKYEAESESTRKQIWCRIQIQVYSQLSLQQDCRSFWWNKCTMQATFSSPIQKLERQGPTGPLSLCPLEDQLPKTPQKVRACIVHILALLTKDYYV